MHFKSKNLSLLLRIKCTCALVARCCSRDGNEIARAMEMKNENRNSIKLEKMFDGNPGVGSEVHIFYPLNREIL